MASTVVFREKLFHFDYLFCVSVILGRVHGAVNVRRSEDNSQELVLSYRVDHGIDLRSSGLAGSTFLH